MAKGEGDGGTKGDEVGRRGRFFLESRKKQRTSVVDGKAAGIKLEDRVAVCPVAGKTLRCLVWSKLRPVIPSLFPFGRATHALRPAALSAATGAWLDAENRRGGWQ